MQKKNVGILVRLAEHEIKQLDVIIKDLTQDLESQGLHLTYVSRSQMCKTIIINYINKQREG